MIVVNQIETRSCSWCGLEVKMTWLRKYAKRKANEKGREVRVFCDALCNTDYYNNQQKLKRLKEKVRKN